MKTIGWDEAMEALYGSQISDKQVPVWEHYLTKYNTNSEELVLVIEMAAEEGIKAEEWRVTVRDLVKWLKIYRARKNAENMAADKERIVQGIADRMIQKKAAGVSREQIAEAIDAESRQYSWMTWRNVNEISGLVFQTYRESQ